MIRVAGSTRAGARLRYTTVTVGLALIRVGCVATIAVTVAAAILGCGLALDVAQGWS